MLTITIDSREPQRLITYLKRKYKGKIEFATAMLPEGDFLSDHVIVERKEIGDLYSSIMDGRLKNQCCKMALHNKIPVLVIHGNLSAYAKKMRSLRGRGRCIVNEMAVISAIAEAQCRYGMLVLWTENVNDCLNVMVSLIKDVEDNKYMMPATCKPEQLIARLFGITVKQYSELIKVVGCLNDVGRSSKTKIMSVKGIGEVKAERILKIMKGELQDADRGVSKKGRGRVK